MDINYSMQVIKRDGKKQPVSFDKVLNRIESMSKGLIVDPTIVARNTIGGIYNGVKTTELDRLAINVAQSMEVIHPDYGKLSSNLMVSNFHKNLEVRHPGLKYGDVATLLRNNPKIPLINPELYDVIMENREIIEAEIDYNRDFNFDSFGFATLENKYLMGLEGGEIIERPQDMFMRVGLSIHCTKPNTWEPTDLGLSQYEKEVGEMLIDDNEIAMQMAKQNSEFVPDFKAAFETYHYMSKGYFTHATPTLYNAGTMFPNYSSCFLVNMESDSIEGIYNTLKYCALISKAAGGIGVSVQKIRAKNSYIAGTNGYSNGLIPMLRVYNDTAYYVDQGGGKRKGAFAIYLEPWHADIEGFLDLKKKEGKIYERAWDLFYALWVPDLFMRQVQDNSDWYLMCPNECPGLDTTYGDEFEKLYWKYVEEGNYREKISARKLWFKILESQVEDGVPYMLFKDTVNNYSNQSNLGVIPSSNLCAEISEYSCPEETAVCNLASVALSKMVQEKENGEKYFNHDVLHNVVKVVTRNLNKIIDRNYYPIPQAARSNYRHRPIGIGVQGFANALAKLRLRYGTKDAINLEREIFETICHAFYESSCELAKEYGAYPSYNIRGGSPVSRGIFKFDQYVVEPTSRWDWKTLRENVARYGIRNSLGIAPMPTASTSQIMGNIECFEPYKNNLFTRTTDSGTYQVVNSYLIRDLIDRGIWNEKIRTKIVLNKGSIQNIEEIPDDIKYLYPTIWELNPESIIDHSIACQPFIDQNRSMNLFVENPTPKLLTKLLFKGWKGKINTGMYYLRTRSAAHAADVVDIQHLDEKNDDIDGDVCYPGCESCSG